MKWRVRNRAALLPQLPILTSPQMAGHSMRLKAAGDDHEIHQVPPESELWIYRDRTTAMLRRYFRLSVELGRLPSLLGREFFRARVTSYRMHSFEDAVIFVHDVENC